MEIQEILKMHAALLSQEQAALRSKEPVYVPCCELQSHPLTIDYWSFGPCWEQVKNTYATEENLFNAIKDRKDKIEQILESFRTQATVIDPYELELISKGISGSYFLLNEEGIPQYIVKPIDEDAGCLNNPKKYRSPFDMSPVRSNMPLYCAPFREVATYDIACMIGVEQIAPKTVLAIIQSETFFDFSEAISSEKRDEYLHLVGPSSKEKLCSAQEFVPNSKALFTALQELQALGLSDDEIAARFDQKDFEDANLLLWCTYDTDGHSGNFLCYPKGVDALGNEILGIKKIDNGLAFPEKNKQLRNHLANLPNAKLSLSEGARAKIAAIDVDAIAQKLENHHLETSVKAFRERMSALKGLAQDPSLTIQEINRKMGKI